MSSQQFQREEANRGYTPQQPDASNATSASPHLGSGTDVIGEPVNPLSGSAQTHTSSHPAVDPAASGKRASQSAVDPAAAGSRDPPISPMYDSQTPANANSYTRAPTGNFPSAQMPQSFSSGQNQAAAASQQPNEQTTSHSPYVQTTSVPGSTGKTPMDSIMSVFNKWSKKAEDMTGNYWGHLKTGPNVADTAMGRIALGTRAFSEGGLENVYRQTFDVGPEEHLLKTYACYLSTSTGPVAGTLYISSNKLAFCSDRPLAIPQAPGQSDATNQPTASGASDPTGKQSSSAQKNLQHCYYKVMVPISQVESVNPSENTQKQPPEKYVQVKTSDGHEFWFLGFVNYDKGVKNLQEALVSKSATSPTNNTASYADANPTTNPTTYGDTNPTTKAASYGDAAYANPTTNPSAYGDTSHADTRAPSHHPSHHDTSSYADANPTTNPTTKATSYGDAAYANPTANPSAYGDASHADTRPPSHGPSHHDTSYATDTRAHTGPPSYDDDTRAHTGLPSYDDANPTTNPSSYDSSYATDTRAPTGPPSYDDANPTTNPTSHVNTTSHV